MILRNETRHVVHLVHSSLLTLLAASWLAVSLTAPQPATLTPHELLEREAIAGWAGAGGGRTPVPNFLAVAGVTLAVAVFGLAAVCMRRPQGCWRNTP